MICTFRQYINDTSKLDGALRHLSSVAYDVNSDSMTDTILKTEKKN